MQDFDYFFHGVNDTAILLSRNLGTTPLVNPALPGGPPQTLTMPSRGILFSNHQTSLTVRSRDGLDQREKLIEHLYNTYPLITVHSKAVLAHRDNPEGRVSIYVERGVPDYFFVYAERDYPAGTAFIADGHPIVVGFEVYGRTNRNMALSSYLGTKEETWQATLRNSHRLAGVDGMLEVGGALISKEDIGTLERDEFSRVDCFDYEVRIILENEPGGSAAEKLHRDTN